MNQSSGIPSRNQKGAPESCRKSKVVIDKRGSDQEKKWMSSRGSEVSTRQITTLLLARNFQEFIKFLRLTG